MTGSVGSPTGPRPDRCRAAGSLSGPPPDDLGVFVTSPAAPAVPVGDDPVPSGDLLEMAWVLIASADTRLIDHRDDEWGKAARRWRDGYHALLDAERRPPALGLEDKAEIRVEVLVPDGVLDGGHSQFGSKVRVPLGQTRTVAQAVGLGVALQLQVEDAVSHMFEELGPQLQPAPGFLST